MIWFIGVWSTVHKILAIKISKNRLTQQKFKILQFQTLISPKRSHSIINNNIFWKCVTRTFRCIYVTCFNIFRFFCWGQHEIKKMHFFQQFKDNNSGMETTQITPFFSSTFFARRLFVTINFWIWKYLQFIFKSITLVHSNVRYLNFLPKATDSDSIVVNVRLEENRLF